MNEDFQQNICFDKEKSDQLVIRIRRILDYRNRTVGNKIDQPHAYYFLFSVYLKN